MKTKIIFLVILTMNIYINIAAQNLKYIPNPQLDKFVGTWTYIKNGQKAEIVLKKTKINLKDISTDVIEGYHILTEDDKVIENSLTDNTPSLTMGSNFNTFNGTDSKNTNQITLSFFDLSKKKSGYVILNFLAGEPDKIQWKLRNREGIRIHESNQPHFDKTFTLPYYMTLTRENK